MLLQLMIIQHVCTSMMDFIFCFNFGKRCIRARECCPTTESIFAGVIFLNLYQAHLKLALWRAASSDEKVL